MEAIRESVKFFTQLGMPSDLIAPLLEELKELTAEKKDDDEGLPETVEVDDGDDDDDDLDMIHQRLSTRRLQKHYII
jgi:hypothetical protein